MLGEERHKEDRRRFVLDKLEIRRGGTHKEVFTVKCAFMSVVYGIVKVEYSSYNKGEYFVSISQVITLILPKCVKTREPEDDYCVLQCTWE